MSANHNDRSQTSGESTFNSLGLEILLFFLPLSKTLGCVHLALYQLPPVLLLQGGFTRPPSGSSSSFLSFPPRVTDCIAKLVSRLHTLDFCGFDDSDNGGNSVFVRNRIRWSNRETKEEKHF